MASLPDDWDLLSHDELEEMAGRLPEALATDEEANADGVTATYSALCQDVEFGDVVMMALLAQDLIPVDPDNTAPAQGDDEEAVINQVVVTMSLRVVSGGQPYGPDVPRAASGREVSLTELDDNDALVCLARHGDVALLEVVYRGELDDGAHAIVTFRSPNIDIAQPLVPLLDAIVAGLEPV